VSLLWQQNHNTADFRAINKFKQQKKACFEAKSVSIKNDLALIFLFEEIDTLKRLLKAKKNVGSKKRKAESLLSKAKEEVFLGD
jgi:hypothetical protein